MLRWRLGDQRSKYVSSVPSVFFRSLENLGPQGIYLAASIPGIRESVASCLFWFVTVCARPAALKGQMMGQSPLARGRVNKASATVAQGFGGDYPEDFLSSVGGDSCHQKFC